MITNSIFYLVGVLVVFVHGIRQDRKDCVDDGFTWFAAVLLSLFWPLSAFFYIVSGRVDPFGEE